MDTFEPTGARGTRSCSLVLAAWLAASPLAHLAASLRSTARLAGQLSGVPHWVGMAVGSLLAAALVADGIAAWRASA